ncbi:MAG: cyclase family protein, partial [Calditrichaeota bacterium]|nr:cyclase family protein [Calditrichota bacterium]
QSDHLTLSSITTTVHLGAHTDAPNHYAKNETGISGCKLEPYLGRCQVITVDVDRGQRIQIEHLATEINATRILFRTLTFPDPNNWNNDFAALSAELVNFLARQRVQLIGIDTPSVDLFADKKLEAHNCIYRNRISILEGIILDAIKDGFYELIALPLNLKNADASPVRAVLRDL